MPILHSMHVRAPVLQAPQMKCLHRRQRLLRRCAREGQSHTRVTCSRTNGPEMFGAPKSGGICDAPLGAPECSVNNPKHPSRTIIPSGGRSRKHALRRASSSSRFRWFQSRGTHSRPRMPITIAGRSPHGRIEIDLLKWFQKKGCA